VSYLGDLFGLEDRAAVVTGGGGTLGGAMAEALARAGAHVALWGRTLAHLERRAAHIAAACGDDGRAVCVEADLLEEAQVERALARTLERLGDFHVLVNACGGNVGRASLPETDVGDFEQVLRLNLLAGCLLPTKHAVRHWIGAGIRGSVVNVASMAAHVPLSGVAAYSAAKAAVVNLTRGSARELARHGIRVNAISPGFFLAEQNRALLVDAATGGPTARGRQVLERTPFGRFGEPEELAGVCLLLASERASGFLTGATLPVDGGFLVDNP
jgi:NAD(P)-dependent dehydrogenase (short-subunit alcohol dehydrogenase family)